jgi:hypothetical protein
MSDKNRSDGLVVLNEGNRKVPGKRVALIATR